MEKLVLSILNGTIAKILTLDFEEIKKKLDVLNATEAKIRLNNSICDFKQNIIEISEIFDLFKGVKNKNEIDELKSNAEKINDSQLFNESSINDYNNQIDEGENKTLYPNKIMENMVDILDKTLSKYINTTLLPLDILNVAHKYGNVTKAKEIIRDLKEDFEKGIDKIDSIPNNISDRLVNYAKNKKEELKESVKKLLWI